MSRPRTIRIMLAGFVCWLATLVAACQVVHHSTNAIERHADFDFGECQTAKDPSMMSVAHDLDHLEKHIDCYGSVVPKTPDVWGQARLTKHRQEFEAQMAYELDKFKFIAAGRIQRLDQLYLTNALALNMAISGGQATTTATTGNSTTNLNVNNSTTRDQGAGTSATKSSGTSTTSDKTTETGKPDSQKTTRSDTSSTTNSNAASDSIKGSSGTSGGTQSSVTQSTTVLPTPTTASILDTDIARPTFGDFTAAGPAVALEPSELLAQKNRYLNFLNQLRRNGEGDDTADSPGYSLNLVRVPVSILPGKLTTQGFGAEVTMTMTAELGEEFLPWMFRKLVLNDLLDHMGYTLTKVLDDEDYQRLFTNENRCKVMSYCGDRILNVCETIDCISPCDTLTPSAFRLPETLLQPVNGPVVPPKNQELLPLPGARPQAQVPLKLQMRPATPTKFSKPPKNAKPSNQTMELQQGLKLYAPPLPSSKGTFFRTPMPTTEMIDVYGLKFSFEIACSAYEAFGHEIETHGYAHYPDVQAFIQEQANGAYRMLMEPGNLDLWHFCSPELVTLIRNNDAGALERKREEFRCELAKRVPNQPAERVNQVQYSKMAAFAWTILVDAALLTDRLIQDMRETAAAKGAVLDCAWRDYAHPMPSPEARRIFNDYVLLRWPIRVFALDPDVEEQNISDRLTTRREMQQALSLAFVTGRMSAYTFTRYARRLDADYETVSLNRTQVGFSHGENTFGWRFYPRFQTPDTQSNLEALIRGTLIGGPNRDELLCERRLEPGPRECVALVMMPSFVPYLTLDSTSNWFQLTNPKCKVFDHSDALKLSRVVKTLQTLGQAPADAMAYRDSDQRVLRTRVEQLAARLPLQSTKVQVPMTNTVGGHAMFNNGITDLAPELYGFYGAPGVDKAGGTTLFLVGDHFSVNRTEVIVGNRAVTNLVLLSRQVAKVTLAPDMFETKEDCIRVHVATPYGVSREVDIPLVGAAKVAETTKTEGFTIKDNALTIVYEPQRVVPELPGKERAFNATFKSTPTEEIVLTADDAVGNLPAKVKIELVFDTVDNAQPATIPAVPLVLNAEYPKGRYVIPQDGVKSLAQQILQSMNDRYAPFPADGGVLGQKLKFKEVRLTPVDDKAQPIGKTVTATNTIEVTFSGAWPKTKAKP